MSKFRRQYPPLSTEIEDIVRVSEARLVAVMRLSVGDLIENAQQSVYKGGRMRIDTGFLRASGQASLTGMPTGPERGDVKTKFHYDDGNGAHPSVEVALGEMKIGSTLYFGWTANYAQYREVYDGFLEGALQHWQRIVAFHTDEVRRRVTGKFYAKRNAAWGIK